LRIDVDAASRKCIIVACEGNFIVSNYHHAAPFAYCRYHT
jgi:hypothetical protein